MELLFSSVAIVIPCRNEVSQIPTLVTEIDQVISSSFESSEFEIIVVDDGSSDNLFDEILGLRSQSWLSKFTLQIVQLSKNYGKDNAILAGFQHLDASSELIFIIDADGQHPPTLIPDMFIAIKKNAGVDQVVAFRGPNSYQSYFRSRIGNLFSILNKRKYGNTSETDFRVIRREIVERLLLFKESKIHLQELIAATGPSTERIFFDVRSPYLIAETKRKSRWSNLGLFDYATLALLNRQDAILALILWTFAINTICAVGLISATIARTLSTGDRSGTSTILIVDSLYFIMVVVMLFLVLLYVRQTLLEVKQRPRYFIKRIKKVL